MKRIHALGLCLAAGLALAAFALPSSAFAGEYGQCKELTKTTNPKAKHGKYTEGNCLTLYEKKGKIEAKGNFEWFPGPSPSCVAVKSKGKYKDAACTEEDVVKGKGKGHFERLACYGAGNGCAEQTSSTGKAKLSTEAGEITCSASTGIGAITGPKSDTETVSFTGCESLGAKCTSVNTTKEGEIKTFLLETTLIDHGEKGLSGLEPKEGEAWVQFSNQHGAEAPWNAKFACAGVGFFEVDGSVSGPITPVNTSASEASVKVEKGVAEQDLKTTICTSPTCESKLAENLASTQSAENAKTKDAEGETSEVKT